MRKAVKLFFFAFLILASAVIVRSAKGESSAQTYLQIVNPLTGDEFFNFTVQEKSVGDTFVVNLTVVNVTGMDTWQIGLNWNSSLLTFVNASVPSDNILGSTGLYVLPPDTSQPERAQLYYAATLANHPPPYTIRVNGTGTLAQLEFRIDQRGGETDLAFVDIGSDTFLLGHDALDSEFDIPFATINGHFSLSVGKTWHVPQDFLSIPEAINAASIGDTIEVAAGTYPGFTIDKAAIQVAGVGNGTMINGTIAANADRVSLTGLTVDTLTGIVTIVINGNTVELSSNNISSYNVQSIVATGNVTTITNNFLTAHARAELGIEVYWDSRIINNTLKGYSQSVILDGDENEVSGNDLEGSISMRSSFNEILNNNVSNGNIVLISPSLGTNNNTIRQNIVNSSSSGIFLHGSYNKVINNTVQAGLDGVNMSDSDGHDNEVSNNVIRANDTGIVILQAGNSSILGNSLESEDIGIYSFGNVSGNNIIIGNNISRCSTGIEMNSNGWLIFCNNFINNSIHAEDNGNNTWYNYTRNFNGQYYPGIRGNYWGGWNISEPYSIPGVSGSIDRYPIIVVAEYPIVAEFSQLMVIALFMISTSVITAFHRSKKRTER